MPGTVASMDVVRLVVGVVVLVAGVVAAKRAGWLTGTDEELRRAVHAEDAARARPKG